MSPNFNYNQDWRNKDRVVTGRHLWSRGSDGGPPPSGDTAGALFYAQTYAGICDSGGTYTGTGTDPIVWPSAIWHHYATQFAGVSSGDITTAANTFGSFTDARVALNAKLTGNWDLTVSIPDGTTPSQLRERFIPSVPMQIWRSMLDGKFKCLVYDKAPGTYDWFLDPFGSNYAWSYQYDMARGARGGLTPLDSVICEVHVRYGLFAPTGELTKDCWVSPDGSDDGAGTADQTGAITTATDRTARAVRSRDFYGMQQKMVIEAPEVYTDEIAQQIRNWAFDMRWRRKVTLQFPTGPRAVSFEKVMATLVASDVQDNVPCPYLPIDGNGAKSWTDLKFYGNAKRQAGLADRYMMSLVETT